MLMAIMTFFNHSGNVATRKERQYSVVFVVETMGEKGDVLRLITLYFRFIFCSAVKR
ncbi:Hypothetical protein ETEE_3661 [Edwardsiella anguillarum ET080813]|uniref:Uncharacterized protein n=1 Tax=Edwardsiella anguillarum ET080813 TaxID=667120 RepID=A0A076LQ39_9GAMM|nr:Hypothetical protein ETEE_3661 [Edwardsiella anguillarum ET080813]